MWGGKQHTSFTRSHAQACLRVREVGALRVTYLQASTQLCTAVSSHRGC